MIRVRQMKASDVGGVDLSEYLIEILLACKNQSDIYQRERERNHAEIFSKL